MKQKTISASYLKMFLQCTQKFYYRYHTDKQPIVNGEARAFGTAIHEAMEHMYTILSGDRVPTEEDYVSVCDVFIKSGIKNNLCDQNLYDEGRLLLKQRIDDYAPIKGLLGLELKFGWGEGYPQVCTPKGTPIMGAMDKVYEITPTTIVVEDYKTSRVALTDEELQKDEQLSMYDYAVREMYPQYKDVILVLNYLRMKPIIAHRSVEDRAKFVDFLDHVYTRIGELTEKDIKPNLNSFCGWCDYKCYCPAYNKVITDPDLLKPPIEMLTPNEFVLEWERFGNVKRIVDGYKQTLSSCASSITHDSGESTIMGEDLMLYRTQNNRVTYDVSTILDNVPRPDCVSMLNVNKSAVDRYLMDHPEIAGKVAETSQASYASPFFKIKKTKK